MGCEGCYTNCWRFVAPAPPFLSVASSKYIYILNTIWWQLWDFSPLCVQTMVDQMTSTPWWWSLFFWAVVIGCSFSPWYLMLHWNTTSSGVLFKLVIHSVCAFTPPPPSLSFPLWEQLRSCGFTLGTINPGMRASSSLAHSAHFYLWTRASVDLSVALFFSSFLFFPPSTRFIFH